MADPTPTLPPALGAALGAALAAAVGSARGVRRDGENKHHGYKYASAESIIDEGRSALSSHGLSLLQTQVLIADHALHDLAGKEVPVARSTFVLLHESGESMSWVREWPVVEGKGRPIDKAHAASLTAGLAYAIRDVLLLPRDEEAAGATAMDRRDDTGHDPAAARAAAESERDTKPANDAPKKEAPKQEDRRHGDGDPFDGAIYERLLAEIKAGHLEAMHDRIAKSGLAREQQLVLEIAAEVHDPTADERAIAKLGARVKAAGDKGDLTPAWEQTAVDILRERFQSLANRRKAS